MTYQRDFSTRIRLGVIGVGSHSYRNLLPTLTFLPVELVAICDRNEELLASTAKQYGAQYTFTDTAAMYKADIIDAVLICVGPKAHPTLAIEAMQAGVHVWLEKPVAMRAADVRSMMDTQGDQVAVVGFKKAFMPATQKAVELLDGADKLRSLCVHYPMSIPENGEQVLANLEFSNWLGNGVHSLAAMIELGGNVKAVTTHRAKRGGGACILHFESGAIGNFHLSDGMRHPGERYEIFGEDNHITIDNGGRVSLHRGVPHEYSKSTTYAPKGQDHGTVAWEIPNTLATLENKALFTQGFYDELMHFCQAVLNNTPATKGTLAFAYHLMQVYEAALLSSGDTVTIGD